MAVGTGGGGFDCGRADIGKGYTRSLSLRQRAASDFRNKDERSLRKRRPKLKLKMLGKLT